MFEDQDFQKDKWNEKVPHENYSRDVNVRESEKLSEIRNSIGMLCYIVAMTTYDSFRFQRRMYQIEVTSHYNCIDPIIVYHKEDILNYMEAEKIYNETVKRYTLLTKAQNKDIEDINLFKDKILYQQSACCLNCKFCKQVKVPFKYVPLNKDHFPYDDEYYCVNPVEFEVKLECHNPCLFKDIDEQEPHCREDLVDKLVDGREHLDINSLGCNHQHGTINLHPEVEPDGVCKMYEKQVQPVHRKELLPSTAHKEYCFRIEHDNHGKTW